MNEPTKKASSTSRGFGWLRELSHPVALLIYSLLVLALIAPTFTYYIWDGHEMVFPIVRIQQMAKVWAANGPFHTPWLPDFTHGYGWPVFTFYAPLGYYVGTAGHFLFGLDFGPATRLSYYLSVYFAGLLMYAYVCIVAHGKGWPRMQWWALVAATLYTFAPYHTTDLFARSALSECWAWPALAGVLCAIEVSRTRPGYGFFLTVLASGLLILSHNISAMYGAILIGLYTVLTAERVRWPFLVAAAGFWGALLATYFWLPSLELKKLVLAGDPVNFEASAQWLHDQALFWRQHLIENYGRGFSTTAPNDQIGTSMGYVILAGSLMSLVAMFRPGLTRVQRYRVGLMLGFVAVLLFVMSRQMPWESVPEIFRYVQFSWRLLIFTSLFGSIAIAMSSPVLDRWVHPGILIFVAVVNSLAVNNLYVIQPYEIDPPDDSALWANYMEEGEAEGWYGGNIKGEYLPLTADPKFGQPAYHAANPAPENRWETLAGEVEVFRFVQRGTEYRYQYRAEGDALVQAHLFYFPGWEFEIDGEAAPERMGLVEDGPPEASGDRGLIALELPSGGHEAVLRYTITEIGREALWVSYVAWAAWAMLGVGLFVHARRRGTLGADAANQA